VLVNESLKPETIHHLLEGQNFGDTRVSRTFRYWIKRPLTGVEDFRRLEDKLGDKSICHNENKLQQKAVVDELHANPAIGVLVMGQHRS
jgi:F420-0:gamma-glutamyl ligase